MHDRVMAGVTYVTKGLLLILVAGLVAGCAGAGATDQHAAPGSGAILFLVGLGAAMLGSLGGVYTLVGCIWIGIAPVVDAIERSSLPRPPSSEPPRMIKPQENWPGA